MPTNKKRVQVSFNPDTYELLTAIAKANNIPMSMLINKLITIGMAFSENMKYYTA